MYPLHKLEIVDCIPSEGGCEGHGKILEVLQVFPQVNARDIIDDVQ